LKITSVKFRNFKALEEFSLSLQEMNVLVGANNSGKSTIISAFRTLAQALRRANSRSAEPVAGPSGKVLGHIISTDMLPMSVENVHTNYNDSETFIEFRVTGGSALLLYFPPEGGCHLIPNPVGKQVRRPSEFRTAFPISIGVVPVLGPVEHEEPIVQEETVRRELETHRASRHFRNYWYQSTEGFERFAELVESTWPGMSVQRPERPEQWSKELAMFCLEDRIARELYWSGFGFQVWCQMLTHILRSADSDLLVVDEPDIYLHPDIQRQLVAILRVTFPRRLTRPEVENRPSRRRGFRRTRLAEGQPTTGAAGSRCTPAATLRSSRGRRRATRTSARSSTRRGGSR